MMFVFWSHSPISQQHTVLIFLKVLGMKDLPGHLAVLEVNKIFNVICYSARGKIEEYVAQHLFRLN